MVYIKDYPKWNGFTVEQYLQTYWNFEEGKIDEELFNLYLKDSWYKKDEPSDPDESGDNFFKDLFDPYDWETRFLASRKLLICHMFESFFETPKRIGKFYQKILFHIPKLTGDEIDDQEILVRQESDLKYLQDKAKENSVHIYDQYFRPSLYEFILNDEVGSVELKKYVVIFLGCCEKDIQVIPYLKRLIDFHPSEDLRATVELVLQDLLEEYPDFAQ